MAAPLTQTLVVQEHDEADGDRPVHSRASGKARRHPVRRRRRHHRMVGHHRQAVYVHAARADRRARGGVLQQAAEAQLAASADSAAIIAKVNSTLTKLKAAGILA